MDGYRERLSELAQWLREMPDCPGFDDILLADHEAISALEAPIPRSELRTVEAYESHFGELATRNLPWIHMQAAGVLDGHLVVVVRVPPDSTANRDAETAVNFSGPTQAVRATPGWDVRKVLPFA